MFNKIKLLFGTDLIFWIQLLKSFCPLNVQNFTSVICNELVWNLLFFFQKSPNEPFSLFISCSSGARWSPSPVWDRRELWTRWDFFTSREAMFALTLWPLGEASARLNGSLVALHRASSKARKAHAERATGAQRRSSKRTTRLRRRRRPRRWSWRLRLCGSLHLQAGPLNCTELAASCCAKDAAAAVGSFFWPTLSGSNLPLSLSPSEHRQRDCSGQRHVRFQRARQTVSHPIQSSTRCFASTLVFLRRLVDKNTSTLFKKSWLLRGWINEVPRSD